MIRVVARCCDGLPRNHYLARSRDCLAEVPGEPSQASSYPSGRHRPGDGALVGRHYRQAAIVAPGPAGPGAPPLALPRCSWPGPARNRLRRRRWLLSGRI